MGTKKNQEPIKTLILRVRITEEEMDLIRHHAKRSNLSVSAYVRKTCLEDRISTKAPTYESLLARRRREKREAGELSVDAQQVIAAMEQVDG